MVFEAVAAFVQSPERTLAVTSSLIAAVLMLLAWRKFEKPALLYAHVFFVLSPVFYIALSINCNVGVLKGLLSWCTALVAKFILYGVPPLLALSVIAGWLILPRLYRIGAKRFKSQSFARLCRQSGIKANLFLRKSGIPEAFTIGKDVFVTVGLFDVLGKEELEAVLLHELYHVKSGASAKKWSVFIARSFSPIAWFSSESFDEEERLADAFAAKVQGTARFVKSARKSI